MGDRVSIQFRKMATVSVAFFSHWNGLALVEDAVQYAKELRKERSGQTSPIDRMEPETVMVDFIREMTKGRDRIDGNFYLGKDGDDGDNSDNGNWVIDLEDIEATEKELQRIKEDYEDDE